MSFGLFIQNVHLPKTIVHVIGDVIASGKKRDTKESRKFSNYLKPLT